MSINFVVCQCPRCSRFLIDNRLIPPAKIQTILKFMKSKSICRTIPRKHYPPVYSSHVYIPLLLLIIADTHHFRLLACFRSHYFCCSPATRRPSTFACLTIAPFIRRCWPRAPLPWDRFCRGERQKVIVVVCCCMCYSHCSMPTHCVDLLH